MISKTLLIASSTVLMLATSAWAQTSIPGSYAPGNSKTLTVSPNERVASAYQVPISSNGVSQQVLEQAKAQAAGNFGPLNRPTSVGGSIQSAWNLGNQHQGIHVEDDCGDCVYKVRLREFMATAITLPPDIKIASIDVGDTSSFDVKKRADNIIVVKPFKSGVDSSMLVYTKESQVYSFYLRAEAVNSKHAPDLNFKIVDRDAVGIVTLDFAKSGNAAPLASGSGTAQNPATDFLRTAKFDPSKIRGWNDYKLWGDKSLKPEQVYRDDQFTYLQYGDKWDSIELPTAYVVIDDLDELVNTRVVGTTYIIESTHRLITLKSGMSYMCIQYKGE